MLEPTAQVHPAAVGQPRVQQDDVRVQRPDERVGLGQGARLADDVPEPLPTTQEPPPDDTPAPPVHPDASVAATTRWESEGGHLHR